MSGGSYGVTATGGHLKPGAAVRFHGLEVGPRPVCWHRERGYLVVLVPGYKRFGGQGSPRIWTPSSFFVFREVEGEAASAEVELLFTMDRSLP